MRFRPVDAEVGGGLALDRGAHHHDVVPAGGLRQPAAAGVEDGELDDDVGTQGGEIDFALLVDGLAAEREQGITIDVAYRYFATDKRTFILADTPGHVQYTRNTVTGMSTSQVVVLLIDARHGVVEQTRRHLNVAALLGVRHVVLVVNKIDLVDYDEQVFRDIESEFNQIAARLGITDTTVVPISALKGDNVVERSTTMDWYTGPTVLEVLETIPVATGRADELDFRFPIQYVIREHATDYRGYAGRVKAGSISVGDEVRLPEGRTSTITSAMPSSGPQASAKSRSGGWACSSEITRPMKIGISASSSATPCPSIESRCAQARPAGPAPITRRSQKAKAFS